MRTAQQLYEIVVKHLRKQGQKSHKVLSTKDGVVVEYKCLYRDAEGNRCPVGCLIPDYLYKPEMESKLLLELLNSNLIPTGLAAELYAHRNLLLLLQDTHDNKPIHEWEKFFRMIADDHKLKYPKP
jgi:hypothetical protein